jgi:hypothetical protein
VSGQLPVPAALPPEKASGTTSVGGWVDPRAGLEAMENTKYTTPVGNQTPAVQPVVRPYTDWDILPPAIQMNILDTRLYYVAKYMFLYRRQNAEQVWYCGM